MLSRLQTVVRQAQRRGYAVGAFNISDLEQAQAVITAATKLRSPVIVNTSEKAIAFAGLEELAALVTIMARKAPIPVVLNLDHGKSVKIATDCLRAGYSGIMFDGSRLPDDQNTRQTTEVVWRAKKYGVGVEGELGQVRFVEDAKRAHTGSQFTMTDPKAAARFVRQTKVAAFAVAIGNAHGRPTKDERLDFTLLADIRRRVSVPLVLHGASGTPPAHIRKAIKLGICKINIDTDLRLAFTAALRSFLRSQPDVFDPRAEMTVGRDAIFQVVQKKMLLFGSRNKA